MKKLLKRVLVLTLVAVFVLMAIASGETVQIPEEIANLQTGERLPFSFDMLADISWESEQGKKDLTLKVVTAGYEDWVDYYGCTIAVRYRATVIFEDMTEKAVNKLWKITLPFSGTDTVKTKIQFPEQDSSYFMKKIHAIYNESFEFEEISGEVIKKDIDK